MITYSETLDGIAAKDLVGFLAHWDFIPPTDTLIDMLKGSTHVLIARDAATNVVCGYVSALSDGVVCGYISAVEVRPAYRKQGIGTSLINQMTERLRVFGVYLSCAPAMVPYYEALNFKPVSGMAKRRDRENCSAHPIS